MSIALVEAWRLFIARIAAARLHVAAGAVTAGLAAVLGAAIALLFGLRP